LLIPSVFLEGFDALGFSGVSAFGLRTSLFERTCPLAIASAPRSPRRSDFKNFGRTLIETGLEPVQQRCPRIPGVGASFKAFARMSIGSCGCTEPICLFQHKATFS